MTAASQSLASCAFCGLPIAGLKAPAAQEPETKYFCCFGCRFAADVTQARGEEGAVRWLFARLGLAIFLTMNVMVFSMALWSQDVYDLPQQGAGIGFTMAGLFRYLCLLFALPVLLLLGGPLLDDALEQLTQGRLSADLLLVIGVAAAYLYSVLSVFGGQGPIYFEVGCMVLVLVTAGRWLEAEGKLRTTAAIEGLHRLLPDTARLLQDGQEIIVPLDQIQPGQRLRVLAGERIPCDGVVRGQAVSVDEQIWTGESKPAVKETGQLVFGGSLNLDGELLLDATAPPRGGALARLIELVQQARLHQSRFERLAQRVSAWFLPVVLVLAVGALAWHGSHSGIDQGILAALAVLLIACPCALGLATPMALWAALGQAARVGLLFRNGEALERLAHIRAVCLDKTGTLTTGQSRVVRLALANNVNQADLLAVAARLAGASTHVHSRAISRFVAEQNIVGDHTLPLQPVEKRGLAPAEPYKTLEISPSAGVCPLFSTGLDIRTLPGRGLVAQRAGGGGSIYLGSLRFLVEAGLVVPQKLLDGLSQDQGAGHPLSFLARDGAVQAAFVFAEEVRPQAREAIQHLQAAGLEVQALTGDSAFAGTALARELGLPVQAGLLPEDKVNALAQMRRQYGPTAMVGDGINDAPALAASDVGIAMGCGADVARDSAAVCLLGNDLRQLPWAIALARRTLRVIRLNLFWAFVYNVGGIALALTGRLNPILAALAMVLSSFLVVTNSLRLRGPAP